MRTRQMKPAELVGKRVCILLASYNGMRFIGEQLDSILSQSEVRTTIFISDDDSTDGTREFISELTLTRPEIVLLPALPNSGASAQNFLRLCREVSVREFDYVAFADQDDVWLPRKLIEGIEELDSTDGDFYSSNVVAFWPDGRRKQIVKSQPQREFDHFFEAAGPGCTYLASAASFAAFQKFLSEVGASTSRVQRHDWFLYAWARTAGYRWVISGNAGLLYRQHDQNEAGANSGLKSVLERFASLRRGWYDDQVRQIARLLALKYKVPSFVLNLDRAFLLRHGRSLRRRWLEAWLVAFWLSLSRDH
jgi:rhamnosyltransferase